MRSSKIITGNIFNIQRFSVQDGPGIRTTVFMKGCPLKCLWCSNPESQSNNPDIAHRDSLCNGCKKCLYACSQSAIQVVSDGDKYKLRIDKENCNNCGKCIEVCAVEALKIFGQSMTLDTVIDEVKKDSLFYANSGGGVTAGGGEPLYQASFVAELLHRCKDIGIHTTLDTCGFAKTSVFERVLNETDLVLFDLKLMDGRLHKKYTSKDNQVILRNLKLVVAKGIPTIIRIPLIPGINDCAENLIEIADLIKRLNIKLHIDLLPYHRFGESKYKMLDREYKLAGLEPLTNVQLQNAVEIFTLHGLDCSIQE